MPGDDALLLNAYLWSGAGDNQSEDVFNEEALGNTVRPTLTEMCEWITDDLDFAANNAPETTLEKGRYTRDYARFCLMRHCLNEGGYMDGYYQKALDMYEALKGKYSLFKSGSNPYTDLFKMPINLITKL